MENKYNESDLINSYWKGIKDKTSFLAVIVAALIAASVIGSIVGKVIPPVLEAVFNPTVPKEVNN